MSLKGKNTKSIKRKDLPNSRRNVTGIKSVKFHHQASAGEIVIDITSLVAPAGFINPLPSTLAQLRMKSFSENLVLLSSSKGTLMEGVTLSYTHQDEVTIKLNFEADEGEIFTGVFFNHQINGTLIADVRTPGDSGTLLEGQRDFNLGEAIPIKDITNQFQISVVRGKKSVTTIRNELNAEYVIPVVPLDSSIYNNYQFVNSVKLKGNDGRVITTDTEDIHFNGSGDGWTSVGDTHFYTVQKDDSVINLSTSVFSSTLALRLEVYINNVLYKNIGQASSNSIHTGNLIIPKGDVLKDDIISIRTTAGFTLVDSDSAHYLNIVETVETENAPSIGDYQMIDSGDGTCQIIRFNIEGGVGGEKIVWANHGALAERPDLSVLQQVDALNGTIDRMKDDLLETTGFDVTDPNRYAGIPTNIDLKTFGDKVQAILGVEVEVDRGLTETKILSGNISVGGDIADFTFTGLEVGREYELTGKIRLDNGTNVIDIKNGAAIVDGLVSSLGAGYTLKHSVDAKFIASSTSVTFDVDGGITGTISGDGTKGSNGSFVQLSKLSKKVKIQDLI